VGYMALSSRGLFWANPGDKEVGENELGDTKLEGSLLVHCLIMC